MAKSLIRNRLGKKTFNNYVPADADNAKAFADAVLDGEYEIFSFVGESGNDSISGGYKKYTLMLKDDSNKLSTYLNVVVPLGKTPEEIRSALLGKTFNGVKVDRVIVLNEVDYTIASDDSSGGEG